jgi:hypothetical protein
MTDELLITKFLERSYKVTTTNSDFGVLVLDENKILTSQDFINIFKMIFGVFNTDNETSVEIFYRWYNAKKREITKDLIDYFDKMEESKGSHINLVNSIVHFKNNEHYSEAFITNYFNDYYNQKFIMPKVNDFIKKVNLEKGSRYMTDDFIENLDFENTIQKDAAIKALNLWYSETIIGDKVQDLLSQLVITLGRRNWHVTWIGHGPMTRARFLEYFKNESDFQMDFISRMYNDWYENKVIDASEREMKSPMSAIQFNNFTNIGGNNLENPN